MRRQPRVAQDFRPPDASVRVMLGPRLGLCLENAITFKALPKAQQLSMTCQKTIIGL
jgi:hypothetical protein